jgi:hypothetical protein
MAKPSSFDQEQGWLALVWICKLPLAILPQDDCPSRRCCGDLAPAKFLKKEPLAKSKVSLVISLERVTPASPG